MRTTVSLLPARVAAAAVAAALLASAPAAPAAAAPLGQPDPVAVPEAVVAPGPSADDVVLTAVATGLSDPVFVTAPIDGSRRLFIVQKTGSIRVLQNGSLVPGVFLSLVGQVSQGSEQGLLGLAFHPAFKTNHKFYVNFTDLAGNTVIREYRASTANPNKVQPGSGRTLLRIAQPYANHNGGGLAFGRDGFLYIGTGDGGSGGDPGNRAQSLSSLLGKMLRIDVNGRAGGKQYRIPSSNPYVGRAGLDEIWARGLRNPWRFSFDKATGALWIGDVGQDRYEEVDRALPTSAGAGRGANWGWRVMEGFHCYSPSSGCSTAGKTLPLLEYAHGPNDRCSVTGGYVYRGTRIPSLAGWYVFGDFCSGEVLAVSATASSRTAPVTLFGPGSAGQLSSFGQDWAGNLFVVDMRGTVYRIDPATR